MKELVTFCAACLIAVISLPTFAAGTHPDNSRHFEKTLPAAGISRLVLNGEVGSIHVVAADTDVIKVKVQAEPSNHGHFIFDWVWGNQSAHDRLPKDLQLTTTTTGGALALCLVSPSTETSNCTTTPASASSSTHTTSNVVVTPIGSFKTNGSHPGWKASWTLSVPARLAATLNLDVGKIEVKGIAGGLNATIDVGSLKATLPRGPINASVDVGSIKAKVGSADYGRVKLDSNIGHAHFSVHGKTVHSGDEHKGMSDNREVHGSGVTTYTLQTDVGNVDLRLGVPGLNALPPLPTSSAAPISAPASTRAPVAASHAH